MVRAWCSGGEAWIPKRPCLSARPKRCGRKCCAAARSSRPAAGSCSIPFITCRPARRWRTSSPCWMPCMNSTEFRMSDLEKLHEAVIEGDWKAAAAVTRAAIAAGVAPLAIVTGCLVPAMDEVGRRFDCEEYFVPEMLLSARAMKASMEIVRPLLAATGAEPVGRVVIGTVKGDLHDIGKNLVASMLEGGGFEVIDLGADVAPARFIEAAAARNANLVALSALLTVTMPSMKTTVDAFRTAGLREKVKIMVGGAPVTQQYADAIGADGYSDSAGGAVALARRLVCASS